MQRRPRLRKDTMEALDELATRNESYDAIIWKLLADAGHVEHDEDEPEALEEPEEVIEEGFRAKEGDGSGLLSRILGWIQEGRDEVLEEG